MTIREFGEYAPEPPGARVAAPGTTSGLVHLVDPLATPGLLRRTDQVPARVGVRFGIGPGRVTEMERWTPEVNPDPQFLHDGKGARVAPGGCPRAPAEWDPLALLGRFAEPRQGANG